MDQITIFLQLCNWNRRKIQWIIDPLTYQAGQHLRATNRSWRASVFACITFEVFSVHYMTSASRWNPWCDAKCVNLLYLWKLYLLWSSSQGSTTNHLHPLLPLLCWPLDLSLMKASNQPIIDVNFCYHIRWKWCGISISISTFKNWAHTTNSAYGRVPVYLWVLQKLSLHHRASLWGIWSPLEWD